MEESVAWKQWYQRRVREELNASHTREMAKKTEPRWIQTQRKTFSRWCNLYLMQRDLPITNLETDLSNGVRLWNLLEQLSGKKVFGTLIKQPKMKIQEIQNLANCIKWIQARGLKVVGIGAEDIQMGNTKLILGLIWLLILRFQIEEGGGGGQQELLDWCNSVLNPQGLSVSDFKKSWQDGRAFCGLVNALEPGTIDLESTVSSPAEENMEIAFEMGNKLFNFARLLEAIDIIEDPDDLSIMCYVSFYRGYLKNNTAFAPLCYAEGTGLSNAVTSKPAEFTVFTVNQNGERATTGKAPVRCKLTNEAGEEVAKVFVMDKGDGTYSCKYTTDVPGALQLHVCIRNDNIKGSVFTTNVLPGEPSPSLSVATGAGLENATAGEVAEFTIQAKDVTGSKVEEGGTVIYGVLRDPTGDITLEVKDNNNGTYSCTYVPRTSGPITLEVNMKTTAFGEGPIAGSPFSPVVKAAGADPSRSIATGEGVEGAIAGEDSPIKVQVRDRFDNNLQVGGDPLNATLKFCSLQGDGGVAWSAPIEVVDNNDGTYDLSYTPEKVGTYELVVKIGDKPIKDMPISVTVLPGRLSPLECTIDGVEAFDVLGRKVTPAGVSDKVVVIAKDAYKNKLNVGGLSISGKMSGPESVDVTVSDNGDGTYDLTYIPTKVGQYQLEVKAEGQPIGGKNPFPLMVIPAAASGANSLAVGDGVSRAKIGDDNSFTVQTRDAFDNDLTMGGSLVGGELGGAGVDSVPIITVDNADGTYTCTYPNVTRAGFYQLAPTVDGHLVKGAPFNLFVSPGNVKADTTIVTLAEEHVAGEIGGLVQLCDHLNNPCSSGGEEVVARLTPMSKILAPVIDNGDGSYDTIYPPGLTGNVQLEIRVNQQAVPGSPWNVNLLKLPLGEERKEKWKNLLHGESADAFLNLLPFLTPQQSDHLFQEIAAKRS
eukprot:TRINITY_DN10288_c0_g2_i11.p1 TRINITY_DN10288_c0_g2~~TRINITY_DN10288_c0_g2_i11.p1  ORF type:complete len:932 (+),score=251.20 TRINITY_DN10288_c0_g2_i11:204-2999(+)